MFAEFHHFVLWWFRFTFSIEIFYSIDGLIILRSKFSSSSWAILFLDWTKHSEHSLRIRISANLIYLIHNIMIDTKKNKTKQNRRQPHATGHKKILKCLDKSKPSVNMVFILVFIRHSVCTRFVIATLTQYGVDCRVGSRQ